MFPFILAAVGGYLIGDSMKSQTPKFEDGGMMAKGGKLSLSDKIRLREIDKQIIEEKKTIREFEEDETEREYDRFGNPSPLTWNQLQVMASENNLEKLQEERNNLLKGKKMADGGMMAKFPNTIEGRMKEKIIQILNKMTESQLDMIADKYDVEGDLGLWLTFLPNDKVEDVLKYSMSVLRGQYASGGMADDA